MSRIGKQVITLPEPVSCQLIDGVMTVTGPLGTLTRPLHPKLTMKQENGTVSLEPTKLTLETNVLWGTYASHLKNMITGVTTGFQKQLVIEGIGYRASLAGDKLTFTLGLSHPVVISVPAGLKVVIDKNNLTLSGIDKELLGSFTAKIRDLKPPEPYKGKGIRYLGEQVRRKVGKKVAATAS